MALTDDLRLAYFILLNAVVIGAAVYAVRRWTRDPVQRAIDIMLVWYLVQYVAVCVPGVLHILSPATMSVTAFLAAGGLVGWGWRLPPLERELPRWEGYVYLLGVLSVAAYLIVLLHLTEIIPIIDTDAVTYHVPAAVQWLQTGRLGLFPTWFFNPANTFSPLAGSAFIAWSIAPLKGDVLARFVEMPAIVLICLAVVQLARSLGANAITATCLGIAVACSRLATSEIASARDDMFLAAFAVIGLAACGLGSRDRFGPWRLGIALGLMLATKYTAVISLPLWLLMPDAIEKGKRWRIWGIAAACAIVLAGPWYLRNLLLTGNPIYPLEIRALGHVILRGVFQTLRSERLYSWMGVSKVFRDSYHGLPTPLLICFAIGWLVSIGAAFRRWKEPLVRACVLGPIVCLVIFLFKSPYAEVRFVYPAILAMFACAGLFPAKEPWQRYVQIAIAGTIAVVSVYTGYNVKDVLAEAFETCAMVLPIIGGIVLLDAFISPKWRLPAVTVGAFLLAGLIYVYWNVYVKQCREAASGFYYRYAEHAGGWKFVHDNLPVDAKIAYTQTFLVYMLYDPHYERRLMYVPPRPDVTDVLHLPHFPGPTPGEPINRTFTQLLNEGGDRGTWLTRLHQSGAQFFFVYHAEGVPNEERWAKSSGFEELFRDAGVAVFLVTRAAS